MVILCVQATGDLCCDFPTTKVGLFVILIQSGRGVGECDFDVGIKHSPSSLEFVGLKVAFMLKSYMCCNPVVIILGSNHLLYLIGVLIYNHNVLIKVYAVVKCIIEWCSLFCLSRRLQKE